MKSDGGVIYHLPPKPLWVPREYARTRPTGIGVRYKTQLCDGKGRVIKDLQEGWNTITDWGMDAVSNQTIGSLVNYLHLSDTLGPAKRVATGGTTLTLVITNASSIAVTASAGFFLAGDVGNTLSITDLGGAGITQELKITAYTDSQHVTCSTRAGTWLPGFTAGTGPFASFGVHFTSVITLANQTQKFNTYDTSAANYNAQLNDSVNSRFIQQRIFLSAAAGTVWTINQLGWSDGNASNYVFGKVNLASPDTVAVGQKYRVTLQLYTAFTPINIASQSVNWGTTIGTYNLQILQECIPIEGSASYAVNWLLPYLSFGGKVDASTTAQTPGAPKWEGDAGYNSAIHTGTIVAGPYTDVTQGAYTNGQHTRTRQVKWSDTYAFSNAYMLGIQGNGTYGYINSLGIYPVGGGAVISKPSGYWCALTFQLFWTRAFTN